MISKTFVLQHPHESHLIVGSYQNGNVKLTLMPWHIEITRPHIPIALDYCWLVLYPNLTQLIKVLVDQKLIIMRKDDVHDHTSTGELVIMAQYLL